MRFKKFLIFSLIVFVGIYSIKNSLTPYAAESSGYIVLLDNENSPISFAGMRYSIADDLKSIHVEFEAIDVHNYKGSQGVILNVYYGNKKNEIHIDSDEVVFSDDSFMVLENLNNEVNVYDSHSNIQTDFDISFDKKIAETLRFEIIFVAANDVYSDKASCVLYSCEETSDKTTSNKETTTKKKNETTQKHDKSEKTSSKEYTKHTSGYGSKYDNEVKSYNNSSRSESENYETITVSVSDVNSVSLTDTESSAFGFKQIVAIVLAVFLLAAAVVCITIGIKKSKVK